MAAKEGVDLDAMSAEGLTALIQAAEAKRAEKREGAKSAPVEEMTQRAAAHGLSLTEMLGSPARARPGSKPRSDAGKPAAIKYRGPDGATWTGRSRPQAWLTNAEKAGRNREDFKVQR